MTTTTTTPALNRIITALLDQVQAGANVVKAASFDPDIIPSGHAVLICVIEKTTQLAPGTDSWFVECAYQGATLMSEDEDKSDISSLRSAVMSAIASMTPAGFSLSPVTIDGIVPGECSPQQESGEEFLFTARLKLAVSNLNQ